MPAKNELGQLFIDFKGLGLGELTKGLSGLNVGLGTATKTAEKLITALNPQKTGTSFRNLADDAKYLNMTLADTYEMRIKALKAGLPEDTFINSLKEAQTAIKELQFDSKFNAMFSRIGVDIKDLMEEKNPLKYMQLIVDALNKAVVAGDEVNARYFAIELGVYDVWKRQDEFFGTLKDTEKLTDKQLENLGQQEELHNKINAHLKTTRELVGQILGHDFMPFLHWFDQRIQGVNKAIHDANNIPEAIGNLAKTKTSKNALFGGITTVGKYAQAIGSAFYHDLQNKTGNSASKKGYTEGEWGVPTKINNVPTSTSIPTIPNATKGLMPVDIKSQVNTNVNIVATDKTSRGVNIEMAPSTGLDFGSSNNVNTNMNYAEGAL